MDSGFTSYFWLVLLAMVITSNTRATKRVDRTAGIRIWFEFIDLLTLGSTLNLRSHLAISSCPAIERTYLTLGFVAHFKAWHSVDTVLGFGTERRWWYDSSQLVLSLRLLGMLPVLWIMATASRCFRWRYLSYYGSLVLMGKRTRQWAVNWDLFGTAEIMFRDWHQPISCKLAKTLWTGRWLRGLHTWQKEIMLYSYKRSRLCIYFLAHRRWTLVMSLLWQLKREVLSFAYDWDWTGLPKQASSCRGQKGADGFLHAKNSLLCEFQNRSCDLPF